MLRWGAVVVAVALGGCATSEQAETTVELGATARLPADPGSEARIGVVAWEMVQAPSLTRVHGIDRTGHRLGSVVVARSPGASKRTTVTIDVQLARASRLVMTDQGEVLENSLQYHPLGLSWLEELQKIEQGDGMILKSGGWDCALQGGRVVRDCVPTAIGCAMAESGIGAVVCLGGAWGCAESAYGIGEACGLTGQPDNACNGEDGGAWNPACGGAQQDPNAPQNNDNLPPGAERQESNPQDGQPQGDDQAGNNGGDNGEDGGAGNAGNDGAGNDGAGTDGAGDDWGDDGAGNDGAGNDGAGNDGAGDDWGDDGSAGDDGAGDDWGDDGSADDGSGDDGSSDDGSGDDSGDDWGDDGSGDDW
ncbi:MAG: hypothetical protein R3F60_10460 [bacterium]